jgi:hypothetical protein
MARAMASPLRVKNTAYFDIAPTLYQLIVGTCIVRSLKAMRPPPDRQASRTKRPLCR